MSASRLVHYPWHRSDNKQQQAFRNWSKQIILPDGIRPLLQNEKELSSVIQRILPKTIADSVIQKGWRIAHLYGLPQEEVSHVSNTISHENVQLQACKVAGREAETLVCKWPHHQRHCSFSLTRSMRWKSMNTTFWYRMIYLHSSLTFLWMKP